MRARAPRTARVDVQEPSPAGAGRQASPPGMVWVPGGTLQMCSEDHYPKEAPTHKVTVDCVWMYEHAVTNAEFSRFVKKTRYVTSAERAPERADFQEPPRSCWSRLGFRCVNRG